MPAAYDTFFHAATGKPAPYGYQRRLARAAAAELAGAASMEGPAPSGPFPCQSRLISIPTGLGKTAASVDGSRGTPNAALDLAAKSSILPFIPFICSPSDMPQGPGGVIFEGGSDAD